MGGYASCVTTADGSFNGLLIVHVCIIQKVPLVTNSASTDDAANTEVVYFVLRRTTDLMQLNCR